MELNSKNLNKFLNSTEDVDKEMVRDCLKNYNLKEVNFKNKICLDLGANIGGFSKIAIENGAKKVISIECDSRNYNKMVESFKKEKKIKILHGAISNYEGKIKIYKNDSKKSHCSVSTINKLKFKEYDEVKSINIEKILKKYNPEIIKVDIEGSEYDILESLTNYCPKVLFIELHKVKDKEKLLYWVNKLKEIYSISKCKEIFVFEILFAYDCLFIKE